MCVNNGLLIVAWLIAINSLLLVECNKDKTNIVANTDNTCGHAIEII